MTVSEAFFTSRRIGDATITVISCGTARWHPNFTVPEEQWRALMPEVDGAGKMTIGFHSYHIVLGHASVLVDAGFDDPDSDWGRKFATIWEGAHFSPGVVSALAAIGIRPEEITHVITTHAHFDHFVGITCVRNEMTVPRFPNAQHLIGEADLTQSRYHAPPDPEVAARFAVIAEQGLLVPVTGDQAVAPGITMRHTPGETPGHSVVHVTSRGATCYLLGDLLHHPCEAQQLDWVLTDRDAVAMRASREGVFADAVTENATLAFSHSRFPGWGRVEPDKDRFHWVDRT